MDIGAVTLLIFGSMFLLLSTGLPVAFALGGLALVFTYFLWGPEALMTVSYAAYNTWSSPILMAAPLFLLMGNLLQESGIADDVYEMFYYWTGSLRGGLAMGTVGICTIFAAIMGISGASTITMGLIAMPSMMSRGYDKGIVIGSIAAGGVLGIIIPPSVIMILYAMIGRESVGDMFAGGIVPGLLLATLYIVYIGVRCHLRPELGPPVSSEKRVGWREKLQSLRAVVLPVLLIAMVLITIYAGICTPTEASAVGAMGAFLCTFLYGRLSVEVVGRSARRTFELTGMLLWILLGATVFNSLYRAAGAQELIVGLVDRLGLHPWMVLILMMASLFILGMLMDDFAVIMLCAPLYVPIVRTLGFDTLWFAILFMINMQMAYLTPPYGFNLFYIKSVVPEGVSMGDIYRSVLPFIGLQIIALVLVMLFPQLALWLPRLLK